MKWPFSVILKKKKGFKVAGSSKDSPLKEMGIYQIALVTVSCAQKLLIFFSAELSQFPLESSFQSS